MLIHYSCRHYRGDVPCLPNKERGRECPTCEEFDPITDRIALIKLGAPGDVLRTTSLLPGIRRHWPGCEITWLTRLDSAPLLQNIGIDRILTLEEEGVLQMLGEKFDVVINLDNDPLAAALATQERSLRHLGFVLDDQGRIIGDCPEAQQWLEMACFDRLKRENQDTYQSHMRRIIGLSPAWIDPIQICFSETELAAADEKMKGLGMAGACPIAFNTGTGSRWKTKRWPQERFLELAFLLAPHSSGGKILLLGGPLEEEENRILALERPDLFVASGALPIRHFMALVSRCGLVVTGDTLALHIALGCGIPTVALFGPTSAAEIEGTGPFIKINSPVSCRRYYSRTCDESPCCMETITARMVHEQIVSSGWLDHHPATSGCGAEKEQAS
ncbi:MAG: hypothetical protein DIKNOCCD_00650 [bacterium]|nr:MAG: Glycosyltransferase family 9 (heptosyltransferase) [Candidatus Hinthialibacteria bacterium OLB16]MBK7494666.1 glycosyltransferase family 9 protein [Candidatus Omnitrophota bacterium]MBV6480941.1 hypothetical protein [bacterium]